MSSRLVSAAVVAALLLIAGCTSSPQGTSPTAPARTPGVDYFVGGWTSTPQPSASVNGTPAGCSKFDYTLTKATEESANVTYDLVCASYAVKGTGTGVLQGSLLKWSASGTVTAGGASCPFVFTDNTATPQDNDRLLVTYNATVCGLGPFSGSTVLQRK